MVGRGNVEEDSAAVERIGRLVPSTTSTSALLVDPVLIIAAPTSRLVRYPMRRRARRHARVP